MQQLLTKHHILHDQRGAVAAIVAVCLILFIAITALAVDIGHLYVVRNELQNAADAAALAGGRVLGELYETMSYPEQQQPFDHAAIITTAQNTALQNYSDKVKGSTGIVLAASDVQVGRWDFVNSTFSVPPSEPYVKPNAVKVTVRRDGASNSLVSNFFAGIIGSLSQVNVGAQAVAAVSGESTACLPIPIGISRYFFDDKPPEQVCKKTLQFYPANQENSCGGWHTYTESPPSNPTLIRILEDLADETYKIPCNSIGDRYCFNGGNLSIHVFEAMEKLFNAMKVKNDGIIDRDDNSSTWTTTIPIYDRTDCSNPNNRGNECLAIWGFSTVVIEEVITAANERMLNATILCDVTTEGQSGGPPEGNIGTIPLLVN